MICRRCLLGAARHANTNASNSNARTFTSTTTRRQAEAVTSATTTQTNPRPHGKPAATSTSAAQPFSTPLTPSPGNTPDLPIQPEQSKQAAKLPQSSVPAGTVLKGLNFMKNRTDPVALEDHEYPSWLWGVLAEAKEKSASGSEATEGDLYAKSKKQRRIAAKALRRQQMLHPEMLEQKVPVYEQSVDLPAGDGTLQGAMRAGEARGDLTGAMRKKRRSTIKEANFLKAMG